MTINLIFLLTVFAAGVLSFFSPCILPLLPVYLGYFSNGEEESRSCLWLRLRKTAAFVGGISVSFFAIGFGAGLAGSFIQSSLFRLFCGIVIIFMGLHQMGLIVIPILNRQKTLSSPIQSQKGLLGSFLLGFCFSFGWTPCIGPILATVLGFSLNQSSSLAGGMLLLLYAAGLAIPFLALAVGSHFLLEKTRKLLPYLDKLKILGGILVAIMGIWMIAGTVPSLTSQTRASGEAGFTALSGETLYLSDLEGKKVYLKFWATWCPVCLAGMKEFDELAQEYADSDEVVVYSVVAPGYFNEMDLEQFTDWATGQELSFPILFDEGGILNQKYGIQGYPTSVFLDENLNPAETHIGHLNNDEIREKLANLAP